MKKLFSAASFLVLLLATLSAAGQCPAPTLRTPHTCGFLYENGNFTGIMDGLLTTVPLGIRNDSVMVGTVLDSRSHGFLYNGTFTIFNFPGAANTEPSGLNAKGQIAGSYENNDTTFHGFLKDGDIYTTLDFPGAAETFALGINDSGVVVGEYLDTPTGPTHGFVYENGTYTQLDYPGDLTVLSGINNQGQMAGYASNGSEEFGFLYSNGEFTKISYPGPTYTVAYGINNNGKVVGQFYDSNSQIEHGYMWSDGTFTLIDVVGSNWTECNGINDNDQIVGWAQNIHGPRTLPEFRNHLFLRPKLPLTPPTF